MQIFSNPQKSKMAVKPGKVETVDPKDEKWQAIQEQRLQARMVKPGHRRLFTKLLEKKLKKNKEKFILEKKRKRIDDEVKQVKKQTKRAAKKAAA